MNRPDNWEKIVAHMDCIREELFSTPEDSYDSGFWHGVEAGADAYQGAIQGAFPTSHEVRLRIIDMVYGGLGVPEFEAWLKEKLLIK